ncbi:hypothetical protein GM3708_644 [Geminocystis sp. NIES-3708]|uniref:E3 ubiquitin ligase family protein n=1 Tax=Geminocystis sp. NIES-3708 TaxID=1615909 RepID=UPI0005FCC079|nr:E3 ubiquitin ligase family protein [Geminocystis sp. NIES-3708]BAQ60238.1 hypothetical protein GM3708_644 [Geminocystis sp. NIES-3708]
MSIIGIVFMAIAIILVVIRHFQAQEYSSLQLARSTNVEELKSTSIAIKEQIGGGNWRDYVKIWGKISVSEPILSEIKQEPCVYYQMLVKREYEEKVRSQNSEGKTEERIVKKSEIIAENNRSISFTITDNTGEIIINPQGAKFDTIKILDEFRPEESRGGMLKYGSFSLLLKSDYSQTRTLGYRYQEFILPVGEEVLVVGTVSDETGNLRITQPVNEKEMFMISLKTDETLTANYVRNHKNFTYGVYTCSIIGLICIIIGIF